MFIDAVALDNRYTGGNAPRGKLDARQIVTIESADYGDEELPGFRLVTLRNGKSWLAKIDAATLAQMRAAAGATVIADNTGLRGIFFEEGEERAYVEVLPIIGWRAFSDGRASEPVFALEPDGACRGYVDVDGCVIPLRANRRRVGKPTTFVDWLHQFAVRYHRNYEPRKPQYVFDLNPDMPVDPLDDRPNLVAGRAEDEAEIKADIALGMARFGMTLAA